MVIDSKTVLQFIFRKSRLRFLFFIVSSNFLVACSVVDIHKGAPLSSSERWMILPFQNYSHAPRAGEQVEEMVATLFRVRGIQNIEMYPQQDEDKGGWLDLNDRRRQEKALLLANKHRVSYAVTGSVDEWQYKLGVGSEPVVGLTLRVIEVSSGAVVWSATGARTGWSTGSLSGTAQQLVSKLISSIEIVKS